MNRARPLTVLLPALLLAGCCCDRTPRRDPYTIVCPSPAPMPTTAPMPTPAPVPTPESTSPCVRPPRLAPAAPGGPQAPAPAIPEPRPAPVTLKIYEVRDLVAAAYFNAKLLADLRPALPTDAQAFIQGDSVIVVKTTDAGHEAAARWFAERRKAVTPVMMVVDVADLTATTPIDTLVERLRGCLPAGTEVNRQETTHLVVRGTPAVHGQVGALLAEGRMDSTPTK